MTNIASECRSANIVRDHATILPDDATPKPDGIFGKDNPFVLQRLSNSIEGPSPNDERDSDDRIHEDHRSPDKSDHLDRVPHCEPPQLAAPRTPSDSLTQETVRRILQRYWCNSPAATRGGASWPAPPGRRFLSQPRQSGRIAATNIRQQLGEPHLDTQTATRLAGSPETLSAPSKLAET